MVVDFVAVGVGVFDGAPTLRALFTEFFAAMPDFALEVLGMVCDDEHAVLQWRATATFTGTRFQGIHATGRHVELRGVDVMRFEQGRLKHNTVYYDGLAFARHIGMLPREGIPLADKTMAAAFNARTDVIGRLRRN